MGQGCLGDGLVQHISYWSLKCVTKHVKLYLLTMSSLRSTDGQPRWPRQSVTSLRSFNPSLDVGVPSSAADGRGESGRANGALFRLTGQPVCRAVLLTSVVLLMMLLTGIIVFLVTHSSL